jgi:hypothetical protein
MVPRAKLPRSKRVDRGGRDERPRRRRRARKTALRAASAGLHARCGLLQRHGSRRKGARISHVSVSAVHRAIGADRARSVAKLDAAPLALTLAAAPPPGDPLGTSCRRPRSAIGARHRACFGGRAAVPPALIEFHARRESRPAALRWALTREPTYGDLQRLLPERAEAPDRAQHLVLGKDPFWEGDKEGSKMAFDLVRDEVNYELTPRDQAAMHGWTESRGKRCINPIPLWFCQSEPPGLVTGLAIGWGGRIPGVWTSWPGGRLRDALRPGVLYWLDCVRVTARAPSDGGRLWFHVLRLGYVNAAWVVTGANDVRALALRRC